MPPFLLTFKAPLSATNCFDGNGVVVIGGYGTERNELDKGLIMGVIVPISMIDVPLSLIFASYYFFNA